MEKMNRTIEEPLNKSERRPGFSMGDVMREGLVQEK
jgi:hypothetical protein